MKKPNNAVSISTTLNGQFFKYWFEFMKPFHNLTSREIEVISCFMKHRWELGKVVKDDEILDKLLLGNDIRKKVMQECSLVTSHFQVIMGKLRKSKVISDNRINPKFIPKIVEGDNTVSLLIMFELNDL